MRKIVEYIKQMFRRDRILFCDLDGTLIETKSGKTFPEDEDDWKLKPYVIDAIKSYKPTAIHIITNQGGIEKGFVDEKKFANKLWLIRVNLIAELIAIDPNITYAYCKSNDKDDPFRKPNPGMIIHYIHDYYRGTDCNPKDCLMIGDASGKPGQFSDSDKKCAENAGIKYMDIIDFIQTYYPCSQCVHCSLGEDISVNRPCGK